MARKPLPQGAGRRLQRRLIQHTAVAVLVLVGSLGLGIWGYWYFAGLSPLDGFLNAAMLLSGMGPVAPLERPGAKLFAGLYALYSGIVFVATAGFLLAPVFHHLLLRFKVDDVD